MPNCLPGPRQKIYSVSQKNPAPPKVFWHFSQTGGNFLIKFYTPVMHSSLRSNANFYLIICNFDEVMPYYVRPPSSHHTRKMSTIGRNARWYFMTFSQTVGIFSPNVTCLLHVPIYVRLQIFIQLPPTVTK